MREIIRLFNKRPIEVQERGKVTHKIILSVQHLDPNQKIEAGYTGDKSDEKNLAREIIMDLGQYPYGEGKYIGGVFFSRIDFNLHPSGGFTTSFHVYMENGKLIVGVEEVTDSNFEFDGVRLSLFDKDKSLKWRRMLTDKSRKRK